MNFSTIKVMSFVIVFVSLFSIASYACSYPFCSSIACKCNAECHDTCDGGFWYYGNNVCSSSCYFSCSNHCNFEKRICADSDASDNFPVVGGSVKICNAECDQNTDCKDKCISDVRYYSGSCNLTSTCSCSYKTEDCNSKDGWYNTTNTQWVSNGQCTEKEQKQQEYRDYTCGSTPSVACTYTATNTKWIDTGNTRNKQNGVSCDDGKWCTVNDVCTNGVCSGSTRNCSSSNLISIASCDNNPDNYHYTWDSRNAFTSTCDEVNDKCATGDDTIIHTCNKAKCNAECNQNTDCKDKCISDVRYYSGSCNLTSTCSCSYKTEDCNSKDGWYNTTNTQWISNGQCTEKEQKQQEYRDYTCGSTPSVACTYTVTDHQWIDDGNTRNKPKGTTCDDGVSSTINDTCNEGVCKGSKIDCSSNNLQEIETCDWNPDNNKSTWDFRNAFTSHFDEDSNKCATGDDTITHICNKAKCNAECEQDSDCSCPSNGCVGQDFYEYQASCNGSCNCDCTPIITFNDSRCFVCDSTNVDCNNPACASNIQCLPCDTNNVNCSIPACNSNALCIPCDSTNVNCSVLSCSSNPKCVPCDVSNVDCNVLACANNTQCLPCDNTNVDCSKPACSNNIQCLSCDVNNVNCSIPACASNSACLSSSPPESNGGGMTISGGYLSAKVNTVVCGDGTCSNNETCATCPKDCLKQGDVCCNSSAYSGSCCVNSDCPNGYECNASRECQLVFVQPSVTCAEDWICTSWSDCINDTQTRKCVDKNSCGTTISKPEETQKCETQITPITGLFNFITSPVGLISLIGILLLFLILFFLRRKSKGQVDQASQTTL